MPPLRKARTHFSMWQQTGGRQHRIQNQFNWNTFFSFILFLLLQLLGMGRSLTSAPENQGPNCRVAAFCLLLEKRPLKTAEKLFIFIFIFIYILTGGNEWFPPAAAAANERNVTSMTGPHRPELYISRSANWLRFCCLMLLPACRPAFTQINCQCP